MMGNLNREQSYSLLHKSTCVCVCGCLHLSDFISGSDYLKAGTLVREGRAEEACDDAHDRLRYITLQRGVRMFPVTGVVADLGRENLIHQAHPATLPACVHQPRHCTPLGNTHTNARTHAHLCFRGCS